jgi:agmatine deiminase
MIADRDTNFVYFSELISTDSRFVSSCNKILNILDTCGIKYGFLPDTNDIWARDFMPIQISKNKFIEYKYDPNYLKPNRYKYSKSDPDKICDSIKIKTIKSDIILDGGNVIKSTDSVIMTDKILIENKATYVSAELIDKLKSIFEVNKIVLIPWDKSEIFGHADGMIRFIDDNVVLLNGYYKFYSKKFKEQLFGSLLQNNLTWKELNFDVENEDSRSWAYINYLQTKDIILIPKFGIDEDEQALEQFRKYFPAYHKKDRIKQVNINEIVNEGGALNCISWTINL